MPLPTPAQIDEVLARGKMVTCVVRSWLNHLFKGGWTTTQVRRQLKAMETAGLVERAPTGYVAMLCWRLPKERRS